MREGLDEQNQKLRQKLGGHQPPTGSTTQYPRENLMVVSNYLGVPIWKYILWTERKESGINVQKLKWIYSRPETNGICCIMNEFHTLRVFSREKELDKTVSIKSFIQDPDHNPAGFVLHKQHKQMPYLSCTNKMSREQSLGHLNL